MAHVYRAADPLLNRQVCIKILTPEGAADADTRSRFLAEAKTSASLVHDNVIRIFDYGEEQGRPFIVMELLSGSDLRKLIETGEAGDFANRLNYARQAARALEYIHSQGVVHRDIKPDNLHVDETGRVRLMDFGVAKTSNLNLTKTGFQVGTPYYMAPEQVMGEPPTPKMDLYAFGVLLFELFTGRRAVEGTTIERLFYQILHEPLNLAPLETAGVPAKYIGLIARLTAKKPEERPASFSEVVAELSEERPPAPAPAPGRAGVPGRYVVGALAALALVLTAVFIYLTMSNKNQIRQAVKQMKTNPPVLEDPAGAMVLVPAGPFLAGAEKRQETLPDYYIDRTEADALEWLSANSDWRHTVWAEPFRSNSIPFLAGNRVFYGMDSETVNARQKLEWTKEFFSWRMPVAQFRDLCREYDIRYVYFGPRERDLDSPRCRTPGEYDPATLREAYRRNGPAELALSDIQSAPALVDRLRGAADPMARFVLDALSSRTRSMLATVDARSFAAEAFVRSLGEDLNALILGPLLYNEQRFASIPLRPEFQAQLARAPAGADRARLNRELLSAAFPGSLRPINDILIYEVLPPSSKRASGRL